MDFSPLAQALDAIQDSDGNWQWPCQATVTLMPHGTQNREYTINLADPTNPFDGQAGYCGSTVGNSGGAGNWYVTRFFATALSHPYDLPGRLLGGDFLADYYVIFEFRANLMGFATKNVAASAATVNPLQQ